MNILVVGATGALGRDVVTAALAQGHATTALVREPNRAELPAGTALATGDILEPGTLTWAVAGQDAVICALGTPSPRQATDLLEDGTRNLVTAMEAEGVPRLICVTLLGVGKSRANTSLFYREVILRVLAPMVPDKRAQEQVVRGSNLDWVLVRLPRFVDKRGAGIRVLREGESGRFARISRAELASFLVNCLADDSYVGQAIAFGS